MMAIVKICVVLIIPLKYLRPSGSAGLYTCVDIIFLTEFSNIVLLATNIIEKMTKIATFNQVGDSTPLYEEKSTIVESNTTTVVKINIKISEVFLLRVKVEA
jgi:hypothetical protein